MESQLPRTPTVQPTLTAFYPCTRSRNAAQQRLGKGGSGSGSGGAPATKKTLPATPEKLRKCSPEPEPELLLPLPSKFTHLLNLFTHMNFIVSRSKAVTFERLKASVELATRRTFDRAVLAKVLTVLAIEGKSWFLLRSELVKGKSQLIISAAAAADEPPTIACLNSTQRLLLRRTAFEESLLEITKRRHLQFLASDGLTTAATLSSPEKTAFGWHPHFKLDEVDLVPDMSLLPAEKKVVTKTANSILNYMVPRAQIAEEDKAKAKKEEEAEAAEKAAPATPTPSKKDVRVKGIRPDLLAKVREKEAAGKARLRQFRSPELLLLRQAEPAVRIITSLFTSTGARSFTREKVVKVLADSMKMSTSNAESLLTYLLSLDLLGDPTDLDRRWLRPFNSLSDGVSYIVLQAPPRLAFLKEQIARKIAALNSSD